MRVLITNNTLAERAGTELYVRDIALALRERGHEPIAYSSRLGAVAEELRAGGVRVLDDLGELGSPPDVIHGHHHLDAMTAILRFPRVPAVLFCHGSVPWQEEPVRFPSIRRYVAVDDPCRERLLSGGVPATNVVMLRTFVDLKRFVPREHARPRPRRALVFSNYARGRWRLELIRLGCMLAGIWRLDVVGRKFGTAADHPENILGDYDVVFAKGRAAHEAAATGAAVMVCDYGRFAGLLTTRTYDSWRPLNFGHRTLRHGLNPLRLARELRRYDARDVEAVARRVRDEAGMDQVVDELIALYGDVRAEAGELAVVPEPAMATAASDYIRSLAALVKKRGLLPVGLRRYVDRFRSWF